MDTSDILFSESHAAAQSLKNGWTRMASTYGCMMITLSKENLLIQPHWYAKLPILLLGLDLCHEIALNKITGIAKIGTLFSYNKVELRFSTKDGDTRILWLYMKKDVEFINKVKAVTDKSIEKNWPH